MKLWALIVAFFSSLFNFGPTKSSFPTVPSPTPTVLVTPSPSSTPRPTSKIKPTLKPTAKPTATPTSAPSQPSSFNPAPQPTSVPQPTPTPIPPTPTRTPSPTQAPAPVNPSTSITSNKPRGEKLSPNESFQITAEYNNLPATGQPGCNSLNKVDIELVFYGDQLSVQSTDSYSYPWTQQFIGEPKVYLAYVPCGTNAKLSVNFTALPYPYTTVNPFATSVIAEYGTPNTLSTDKYELSW